MNRGFFFVLMGAVRGKKYRAQPGADTRQPENAGFLHLKTCHIKKPEYRSRNSLQRNALYKNAPDYKNNLATNIAKPELPLKAFLKDFLHYQTKSKNIRSNFEFYIKGQKTFI